ncbi:MAG: TlyA family RNA methyltransferase [Acidimicrobiales bacterium]
MDAELVRRGLATSRNQARELITSHRVRVNGSFAQKAARLTSAADAIELVGDPPEFVGRGGLKLRAALDRFELSVDGRRALDAGASTGGFTDCLLQAGASEVVAVDVGYGQLHERLRSDPRVTNHERTNIRTVDAADLGGRFEMVVGDLSFISLEKVFGALAALAEEGADLVLLIKPQFEAGKREASAGRGVITDPAIWTRVLHQVIAAALRVGATPRGLVASPIRGGEGNVEFLGHFCIGGALGLFDVDAEVAAAVESVSPS